MYDFCKFEIINIAMTLGDWFTVYKNHIYNQQMSQDAHTSADI